jgi:hypothetical protein
LSAKDKGFERKSKLYLCESRVEEEEEKLTKNVRRDFIIYIIFGGN